MLILYADMAPETRVLSFRSRGVLRLALVFRGVVSFDFRMQISWKFRSFVDFFTNRVADDVVCKFRVGVLG